MRGLAAVDLRRHDGVAAIDVVVAHEFVERDQIVGEFLPGGGEELRGRRVTGKETGDVIGGAAHQAERRLGPGLREQAARPQIGVRLRNLPGAVHRLAGFRRSKCHALAQARIGGDVVQHRHRARGLPERRMRGHVLDEFAVKKNAPPVVERAQIFGPRAHRRLSSHPQDALWRGAHGMSSRKRMRTATAAPSPRARGEGGVRGPRRDSERRGSSSGVADNSGDAQAAQAPPHPDLLPARGEKEEPSRTRKYLHRMQRPPGNTPRRSEVKPR